MKPGITVVIPTFNRANWLDELLASLAAQDHPAEAFDVIVIDDGSTDGTAEIAARTFPFQFQYVRQENQGDAAARNHGARLAGRQLLLFIDDDILLSRGYLRHAVGAHAGDDKRIVVGADILWLEDRSPLADSPANQTVRMGPEVEKIPFAEVCSNNMLVSREAYFAVGMMEGLDFPGSSIWCDVDFAYRADQQGFHFLRSRRAVCWHRDYVSRSLQNQSRRMDEAAFRAVALFEKHPDLVRHLPMFTDMMPVKWGQDSVRLVVRKVLRAWSASEPFLALMGRLFTASQGTRIRPVLRRWIVGANIYRGFRRGRAQADRPQAPVDSKNHV